ncbi:MAG: virulence plasmid B protein, partial [Leptospirales bacterium]
MSLLVSFLFTACGGNATIDVTSLDAAGAVEAETAPDGVDLLSSSTNFSQKLFDPGQKADPLSGADFIAPPSVSNYGAVSFQYKLELPPGRAGVMPGMSLGYSSSG